MKLHLFIIALSLLCFSCGRHNKINDPNLFKECNAYVFISLNEGKLGIETMNCSESDYFEAASLTKVLFAQTAQSNIGDDSQTINKLNAYLRHSAGIENVSSSFPCAFKYSDTSYLIANELLKTTNGKSFENYTDSIFHFELPKRAKVKNGYVKGDTFFRKIHRFDTALPNGTLYLNAVSGQRLLQQTESWAKNLLEESERVKLCDFNNLYWLNGIGVDSTLGRPLLFQWGDNWCYRHLMIIDPENNSSFLILTNSIVGAHEIALFCNKKYGHRLELLDFVDWY